MEWLWLFLVWPVSSVIIAGTLFPMAQGWYPSLAAQDRRTDMGMSALIGFCLGMLGPLGIFIAGCVSGFWEHGWRLR